MYSYESDQVITQTPIHAFLCGLVTIIIIKILYLSNARVEVGQ